MPSPSGSESLQDVPEGHVRLVLVLEPQFYLEIPLADIDSLCLKPRKYLNFLGWCILGLEGELAADGTDGPRLEDLDGRLKDPGLYYYITSQGVGANLNHAIDLQVIKERSGIPSETTRTRENFRDRFLERDGFCVFTGATPTESAGVHIIPHRRGSEWFRGIIHNRPNYEENVEDLTEINDIRNGLCMYASAHSLFDQREAVILKTPNRWLNMKDVPPRADRPLELDASVTYPKDARYTLHWLEPRNTYRLSRLVAPNNIDAAFRKRTRKPKPSALLLHYNYGVAAAKRWGHGAELFETHDNPARPKVLESASMGPSKTSHDRSIAIQKLESVQNTNEAGTTDAADGDQPGESTERTRWDTDDLVLFFWGNSPAAMERHRKKQEEKLQDLERWRQGLQLA